MIIVMQIGATQEQINLVADAIRNKGVEPLIMPGQDRVAIGIPASLDNDQRTDLTAVLGVIEGVSKITHTSHPYKLASREFHRADTSVQVKNVKIGGASIDDLKQ